MDLISWFKKNRLTAMLVIPLIFILYFASVMSIENFGLTRSMGKLEDLMVLATKNSALVHEAQKERGMSAGYLGSKGKKFGDTIGKQRQNLDGRIKDLQAYLQNFDGSQYGAAFVRSQQEIQSHLEAVPRTREAISGLNIEVGKAIGFYTKLNTMMLDQIALIVQLSDNGEITGMAAEYLGFLESKERAGIERAVLSNTFGQGKFGPGMFQRFVSLVAAQEAYMRTFLSLARDEHKSLYSQTMKGEFVEETQRMREVAFKHSSSPIEGVDATYWFKMQTGKINLLKKVEDQLSADLAERASTVKSEVQNNLILYLAVAFAAVVVTLFCVIYARRSILLPLAKGLSLAERIANGDLSAEAEERSTDEMGRLLQTMDEMNVQLSRIVADVRVTTDSVGSAANEIAQGSADLSQRTEEQASSLEETAASMEQMTATVRENADNANKANQLSTSAREQAEQGGAVVSRAVTAMTEINKSSKRIADIIGVIDEIAFQTNLLALNAAVEAARAGEQGRGFAVVAGEVRKLAQRSADSAKEIKELITDSVGKVDEGTKLVDESGEKLEQIVVGIKKVSDIVAEITAASTEQSQGIEQVNQALTQMDEVTQQNAALVEQTAAASQAMNDQAGSLQQMMQFFTLKSVH